RFRRLRMSVQVRRGDTLSGLAARYHTTVAELLRLNPNIRNANRIFVGEQIAVPPQRGAQPAPPPQRRAQPAPPSHPSGFDVKYRVQPGDTLSAIGARFGVQWQTVAQVNHLTNPNALYVGQVLTIPRAGTGRVPVKGGITLAQLQQIMPSLDTGRAQQLL